MAQTQSWLWRHSSTLQNVTRVIQMLCLALFLLLLCVREGVCALLLFLHEAAQIDGC